MASYCQLADLKSYLNISASTDDALLQRILDAATAAIDENTQRTFQAPGDETKYFDISSVYRGVLMVDALDLSHITSVINGDGADITASIYPIPANFTPWYGIGILSSSGKRWTYTNDPQRAISVTGRWAKLDRYSVTALTRASNVVTAAVVAPKVSVGQMVYLAGCADASFNGSFVVTANTGTAITWAQTAANDTDTTAALLAIPQNIVSACRRLAAWMYRQKDTQLGDSDRPILAGDGTIIMPSTLPRDVMDLIMPDIRTL